MAVLHWHTCIFFVRRHCLSPESLLLVNEDHGCCLKDAATWMSLASAKSLEAPAAVPLRDACVCH